MLPQITVGNLRTDSHLLGRPGVFRIDRTTALGNPFVMRNEAQRDSVCDQFAAYLPKARKHNRAFQVAFDELVAAAREQPITILCWCTPLRCHGHPLKAAIEQEIQASNRPAHST